MKNHKLDGCNLLIVIPGYGDTGKNISNKKRILDKNLDYFFENQKGEVIIKQFNTPELLYSNQKYKINLIYKDASLSEFLYNYIKPSLVKNYDFLILILDDVEIKQNEPEIGRILYIYNKLNLNILSPSVERANWSYLHPKSDMKSNQIRVVRGGVEFFCYVMNPESYETYYNKLLLPWNHFLWGMDLVADYAGIHSGIYDHWKALHYYISSEKMLEKREIMCRYLNHFFKGDIPFDLFFRMGALKKVIDLNDYL